MKKLVTILASLLVLPACTLTCSNVMTSGTASDVVDTTPQTNATVSPNVSIPASVL